VSVRQNRDITEIRDKFPSRYSQKCTDSSDQNYKNNEGIKRVYRQFGSKLQK